MVEREHITSSVTGRTPQLQQFLNILLPCTAGFAVLVLVAAAFFRDDGLALAGGILACYACLLGVAQFLVRHNNQPRAILVICAGLLIATLMFVMVQPSFMPILIITPLLTVTVALPYTSEQLLRRLIVLAWGITIAVTVLGELLPAHRSLPLWFVSSIRISAVGIATGSLLLLLWQFSSRLTRTLARTRAAEERYALAALGANDGLWDWDLEADSLYLSPRWKSMLGYAETAIGTDSVAWLGRIHPDDRARVLTELAAHQAGETPQFESEHRILHQDGHYRWMLSRGLAVYDTNGRPIRMAGSQSDISVRKQAEQQLSYAALHDPLTGLANRALFMDRLGHALAKAQRHPDYQVAVVFLDLDRFKVVNDSLGHAIGDQLLITIADRLQRCIRPGDTVARLGGDEFTLLLEDIRHPGVPLEVAERIHAALDTPFVFGEHEFMVTTSIGIAIAGTKDVRTEDLLRDADTAMYRAKESGRARHTLFDPSMHAHALARLELEQDLRHAIEGQELMVYYQPILSLTTDRIIGFEGLVRWQHPQRGLISPGDFIPLAQETGLIDALGEVVLRMVCQQLKYWQTEFPAYEPLTVSVNCASTQCVQPTFPSHIKALLEEFGLPGRRLRLEITESVLMEHSEAAASMLAQLRLMDVDVHMDDFGTGYSSLSMLHQFPLDVLKIDRSFIARLGVERDTVEVVQTIVTLAHTLGMHVIAEGVETEVQLDVLRMMGCDFGQGYLFSRPVDGGAATALLASRPRTGGLRAIIEPVVNEDDDYLSLRGDNYTAQFSTLS